MDQVTYNMGYFMDHVSTLLDLYQASYKHAFHMLLLQQKHVGYLYEFDKII
jgi:hypothetical protein